MSGVEMLAIGAVLFAGIVGLLLARERASLRTRKKLTEKHG